MINRNKVFQWSWWYLFKGRTPRKVGVKSSLTLDAYAERMVRQLDLAENFGEVDLVIIGDSNAEELAEYSSMKRFPKLTINLAIGGTRVEDWESFFRLSNVGRSLYRRIKNKKILINVGGNNSLQNAMYAFPTSIQTLADLFPSAWWINLPSVYVDLIASLTGRPKDIILDELKRINMMIATVAMGRLIDIRSFSGGGEGNPYFFVLKDAVHYSDRFDEEIRIPLINFYIYRYGTK